MIMPAFAPDDKLLGEEGLPLPSVELELGEPVGLEVLDAEGELGDAIFAGLSVADVDVNNSLCTERKLEVIRARIWVSVLWNKTGIPNM